MTSLNTPGCAPNGIKTRLHTSRPKYRQKLHSKNFLMRRDSFKAAGTFNSDCNCLTRESWSCITSFQNNEPFLAAATNIAQCLRRISIHTRASQNRSPMTSKLWFLTNTSRKNSSRKVTVLQSAPRVTKLFTGRSTGRQF